MKLLAPTIPSELPKEALLARLRGRRAATFRSDGPPSEEVTDWVCRHMNIRLQRALAPCLELLAMRTLIIALRHALAGEQPPEAIQRDPLLAGPLLRLASAGHASETLVAKLEEALGDDYPFTIGLKKIHRQQGPGGVEQQLVSGFLQHGLAHARDLTVRWLLRDLVDLRNGLAIMKHWQWQVDLLPALIGGGKLPPEVLQRLFSNADRDRLAQLLGAPGATANVAALERALLLKLTWKLRQAARDPLSLAVVLDFLWRTRLAHHDRVLHRAVSATREALPTEALLL